MIRYVLPAAVAAIALAAPLAHAQVAQPMPPQMQNNTVTNTSTSTTVSGQPQPGYADTQPAFMPPAMPGPVPQPQMVGPRTTWIPGHFDWDATIGNYRYIDAQYVEAPRENAQWVPGHWAETPTAWIWIEGGWN